MSAVSYGLRIGIRTNEPGVLEQVEGSLPPGWKRSASPVVDRLYSLTVGGQRGRVRRFHLLFADALRLSRTMGLEELLRTMESDLQLYVAEAARGRVFVHAGVVGWRGKAIVLPGRSRAGKSTLVAALVRAGATYYSDEYAVLDARGRVHPFARPLQSRGADGRSAPVRVEELGGASGTRPLPVGLVAVTRYQLGSRWRPRRLSQGKGLLEVLAHTVSARLKPKAALAALRQVTARATVLKGVRGEAKEMLDRLLERADGEERGPRA